MSKTKEKTVKTPTETYVDLKGMEFIEVLEDLLKIKPVDNSDLKKGNQMKKPKTKK